MVTEKDLIESYKKGSLVVLIGDDYIGCDRFCGYIIGLTNVFVMLHNIDIWHSNGVEIFPLDRLTGIECDNDTKESQNILKWYGVKKSNQYNWVDLSNYRTIFSSIMAANKTITIRENDFTGVGEIQEVYDGHAVIRGIDGAGYWIAEFMEYSFSSMIFQICFDDEYGSVLRKHAESMG